jgi:hypothetical protein
LSDDFEYDEEADEFVVTCGNCGAEVRTGSRVEATQYALSPGKTCEECENDG